MGLATLGGIAAIRSMAKQVSLATIFASRPYRVPVDVQFVSPPGLSPAVTPTTDHYVVDIDLDDPVVSESGWRLVVDGLVERELSLSLSELKDLDTEEGLLAMTCISNGVGGHLIGDSLWTGVPISDLLALAAPRADATTLIAQAPDGYSETVALDVAAREGLMVAIAMNGTLLSREHGFPARLLHPGRYGMRSVKWLERITLTNEDGQGYWEKRGWDKQAVIRTSSRFDVPRNGREVTTPVACGGVAWAGVRGVRGVEVSPDDGLSWMPAVLEAELAPAAWRRWNLTLELPPGMYSLKVRATDGAGVLQEEDYQPPHPSGATGYHRIAVSVIGETDD
jgi:DMSO/TMAO reductase YedYZ molybdopterin-dependent catalytic subunit